MGLESCTKSGKSNGMKVDPLEGEQLDSISQMIVEKDWRHFWRRVIADITNRDLIPVKILFFFQYATLFVLYPFLTLHMAELGLNEWEIGVNQATAPIVAILGPPFVGILADKIGNFQRLLSFCTLVNAGTALLLLLVPIAREKTALPTFLIFDLSCDSSINDHYILSGLDQSVCTVNYNGTNATLPKWNNLPETQLFCGGICKEWATTNESSAIQEYSHFKDLDSNEDYEMIMRLPNGEFFILPESRFRPEFLCQYNQSHTQCRMELPIVGNPDGAEDSILTFSELNLLNQTELENATYSMKLEILGNFSLNGISISAPPSCVSSTPALNISSSYGTCRPSCLLQFDRPLFCKNDKEEKTYNVGLTFGVYTLFRLLLGFASATSFVMFEGAVLAIMKQYGGDYGLQRVFATLAAIIVAPLSGMMLKAYGFRPVIYLYSALKALSAVVMLFVNLEFKKPAEKVMSNLKEVLSKVEILLFFGAMLWSGTLWGYLETFLFLYLERMGASRLLMGLTITIGGIAGLPLLIFSRPIIKRIGHVNCLCLGILFYAFRYFGYSVITNPWQSLFFEALEAITVSLAITAASTYAVALSNLSTIASIQGIFGCLYFGIGRGAGSILGGILIKLLGHVNTFRVFGVAALVGAGLYFMANILYIRKHSSAHTGLDINNLHKVPALNSKPPKESKKAEEKRKSKKDAEAGNKDGSLVNGEMQMHLDGGHVGPLPVNKFTDIPLDEEG